jgi:L,D-peptidoglycan transpeptidase YkuD (ErfK/YbiS/YcfS/YnhG family)
VPNPPRRRPLAAITALALVSLALVGLSAHDSAHAAGHRSLATRLIGIGDATQVISVISSGYGDTTATVRAFTKRDGKWHEVFGPWSAWLGYNGFAPPGAKREGDGRTPSGSYGFSFFFGVDSNPGVHYPWRHAAPDDVWDDDPASPRYNEWVDDRHHSAGRDPEPMHVVPSYRDGAVIAYNTKRVPGRGSAIFLHVTHHSATNGCVSLPRPDVIKVLRWLQPTDHPRIVMGTAATVTR